MEHGFWLRRLLESARWEGNPTEIWAEQPVASPGTPNLLLCPAQHHAPLLLPTIAEGWDRPQRSGPRVCVRTCALCHIFMFPFCLRVIGISSRPHSKGWDGRDFVFFVAAWLFFFNRITKAKSVLLQLAREKQRKHCHPLLPAAAK